MLLALAMNSLIDQWDVEEWWDYPCDHVMVHLVECCQPGSSLLQQPMVCYPIKENCCPLMNISNITSGPSSTPIITHVPTPNGQLIVKECSQKIGVTTPMMSILSTASAVAIILVIVFAKSRERDAMNIFLDSVYG
jgi:hypothetical protein